MKTITLNSKQITDGIIHHITNHKYNPNEHGCLICDDHKDETEESWEHFHYMASEQILYDDYFKIHDNHIDLFFNKDNAKEKLIELAQISNLVAWAYDNVGDTEGDEIWETLGLGGDDDVDYNSSYIDYVITVLCEILKIEIPTNYETYNMDNPKLRNNTLNLLV